MSAFKNVSGTEKALVLPAYNVAGAWKDVLVIYQNVSGAWKAINVNAYDDNASYGPSDSQSDPAPAQAYLSFNSDGSITSTNEILSNSQWRSGGASLSATSAWYEARLTKSTGTDPIGSALSTWLSIYGNPQWIWQQSGVGTTSFTGTIEIRDATTDYVYHSSSVSVTAQVS